MSPAKRIHFTTQDVVLEISQVYEKIAPSITTSMIGRRFGKLQERESKRGQSKFSCRVCGKMCHWYKDNTECREKFRHRMDMVNMVRTSKGKDFNTFISKNCSSKFGIDTNELAACNRAMTVHGSTAKSGSRFSLKSQ